MSRLPILQWSLEQKKYIFIAHGKNVDDVQQDIRTIQEWIHKQPHLPGIPDAELIQKFLILNKFRIEITKEKIDNYYSIRTVLPAFYNKLPTSAEYLRSMDVFHYIPLPKLTNDLCRVIILKLGDTDVSNFDAEVVFKQIANILELRVKEDMYLKDIDICDLTGVEFGHLIKMTPLILKKFAFIVEKVYSNSIHGIHVIGASNYINNFVKLLKSILKKKLADRITVHQEDNSIYNLVPKHILPKDYGGEEKCLSELRDDWKKTLLEKKDMFKYLQTLKVNEKLRPKKSTLNDYFGVEGNFRQLNID